MKNNTLKFVPYANEVVTGKFIELNAYIRQGLKQGLQSIKISA